MTSDPRYRAGQLATMNANDPYFEKVCTEECAWWVQIYDITVGGKPIVARVYGPDPFDVRERARVFVEKLNAAPNPPGE